MRGLMVAMLMLSTLAAAVAFVTASGESLSSATGSSLVPSPAVQRYMDMQLGMFIHFGINTFTNQQSGDGNARRHPPSAFAPTNLSTTQWVSTAKALGAKYVCLTAQHEGGFALWNSSFTNYSSALPAPAGFGVDVLGNFVDAVEEGGLAPCIYFSVSCDAYHGCPMGKCDKEQWFIDMKLGQLRELLGGKYGRFAYMWTDHADGDPLFTAVTELANHLQPEMLILGQDIANIGSEHGYLWFNQLWNVDNTTRSWDGGSSFDNLTSGGQLDPPLTLGGDPDGQYWKSREADKTISSSGWFWNTGGKPAMDVQGLLDLYLRSVGLGSNLILNLPPDRSGQIGADFVNVAEGFGKAVSGMYQSQIASVQNVSGETVVVTLDKNSSVSMIVLREDLSQGQRIAGFVVEVWDNQYGTLRWYQIASGSTVGNQRIVYSPYAHLGDAVRASRSGTTRRRQQRVADLGSGLEANPAGLTGSKWRVRVTATAGPTRHVTPAFRSIELYDPQGGGSGQCFTLGSPTVCV